MDELCHALTDGDGERRLDLCYRIRASRVEVQGTCENPTPEFALSDLAATILGAVVDVYQIALDGDRRTFRLEKTSAGS